MPKSEKAAARKMRQQAQSILVEANAGMPTLAAVMEAKVDELARLKSMRPRWAFRFLCWMNRKRLNG